jgi:hypothetical protein
MFSTRALEKSTDIDAGLDYFLSFFPNGGLTGKKGAPPDVRESSHSGDGTTLLLSSYRVSSGAAD